MTEMNLSWFNFPKPKFEYKLETRNSKLETRNSQTNYFPTSTGCSTSQLALTSISFGK
jgi:hypothetical protein